MGMLIPGSFIAGLRYMLDSLLEVYGGSTPRGPKSMC